MSSSSFTWVEKGLLKSEVFRSLNNTSMELTLTDLNENILSYILILMHDQ